MENFKFNLHGTKHGQWVIEADGAHAYRVWRSIKTEDVNNILFLLRDWGCDLILLEMDRHFELVYEKRKEESDPDTGRP